MASSKRSNSRSFGTILAVLGLVGVIALVVVMSRPPKVIALVPGSGANLGAAGVVVGSADALVEVVEFADFECPGCGYFATIEEPDIMARLVATGEMRFRFMDYPLSMHLNAVAAHNAAACANDLDQRLALASVVWECVGDPLSVSQELDAAACFSNPRQRPAL